MYRKAQVIPPIKQARYPSRILVMDTEAWRDVSSEGNEYQSFRLGVVKWISLDEELNVVDSSYHYSKTPEALYGVVEHYVRKDKTLYIYAHNIKYDLQLSGLLRLLLDNKWTIKTCVIDDPPTYISLVRNKSKIMMVDTFNYWQSSVESMGEQLGLSKIIMPNQNEPDEKWMEYCKRDVDVLSEYLLSYIRFLDDNDYCGLGLTLASQAWRTYRHKFMNHPIHVHNDERVLKLERDAYHGGRTEAWYIGEASKQDYYYLDVNSMYPYTMMLYEYPTKLVGYTEKLPLEKLYGLLEHRYVIAEVMLETNEPVYPVVQNHKLVYPIGNFASTLHHAEIEYALNHGHIKEIVRIAVYEKAKIFVEYVYNFYGQKLSAESIGNKVLRNQSKLMLNSLYGKFGQRGYQSVVVDNKTNTRYGRITGYSERLKTRVEANYLGDKIELTWRDGEAMYSCPSIAGAVTAYARLYLWTLVKDAGIEHVYYMDTDSLIVDVVGYERLTPMIDASTLGMLKLEKQSDILVIYGAKDYRFGADEKIKGVPKKAVRLDENSWKYPQFRGAKTWLKDGLTDGVPVKMLVKRRQSVYDKGIILPGGRVVPCTR